jgi:hypothetical protein
VPRAPLPVTRVTGVRVVSSTTSKGITAFFFAHTSSCAKPVPSSELVYPHLVRRSLQVAASPCWEPVLPDVISAILSPDAWSSTPTVPPSALACFFPGVIGLPWTLLKSAYRCYPRTRFSAVRFRGCHRTILSFKPPSLLVSQIAPTAANFAGQLRLLLPGRTCFVTSARTGYTIRLIQAIDGERTFTFPDLRPCRLLQGPALID